MDSGRRSFQDPQPGAEGLVFNAVGLYYCLHNEYDPRTGTWMSSDAAGDAWFRLHEYCGNNPLNCNDPAGMDDDDPLLYRWSHFLFDDYMGGGKKGEHARDTFNTRALNFLSVGQIVSDEEVEIMDQFAASEGYGDVAERSADAFETTKTIASFIPYVGPMTIGLDLANKVADGEDVPVQDLALLAVRVRGPRVAGGTRGLSGNGVPQLRRLTGGRGPGGPRGLASKPLDVAEKRCFIAGTQVLAADEAGSTTATNIEDIEVGDLVWARDEYTGEEGLKPVVRLFRNEADTLVQLTYTTQGTGARTASDGLAREHGWTLANTSTATATHTIVGTPSHPFWSVTRNEWVNMGALVVGEQLLLAGNPCTTATVTATHTEHLAQPVSVYNFEVASWHTYYVGTPETGWVYVHNLCNIGAVNKLKALKAEARSPGTELHRLASRHAGQVGDGVQYALVARQAGFYPAFVRGKAKSVGNVWLNKGDVWKYGQTKNPGTRYTRKFLDTTGQGLEFKPQFRGGLSHRRQVEQAKIDLYRLDHGGVLPTGNKIRR